MDRRNEPVRQANCCRIIAEVQRWNAGSRPSAHSIGRPGFAVLAGDLMESIFKDSLTDVSMAAPRFGLLLASEIAEAAAAKCGCCSLSHIKPHYKQKKHRQMK